MALADFPEPSWYFIDACNLHLSPGALYQRGFGLVAQLSPREGLSVPFVSHV
jgi:hypothetical protein